MIYGYYKNRSRRAARILAAAAFAALSAVMALTLALPAFAVESPNEAALGEGGNMGGGGGGRLGENYNSPAANGGGSVGNNGAGNKGDAGNGGGNDATSYGDAGREDVMYDDGDYDETFEEGEVLGITDSENSATVGIVIAILIAIAVIVLIIALLPRGTTGA